MNATNRLRTIAAAVLLLLSTGCVAMLIGGGAAAGAGAVAYAKGDLTTIEEASLDRVWSASQRAMEDLHYTVTAREKTGLKASLDAKAADDQKVQLRLAKKTESVTELSIRVGVFGDETASRLILKKIRARL